MNRLFSVWLTLIFFLSVSHSQGLKFVVKPYLQNVSASGITILWETNKPSKGMVGYGQAEINKNVSNLSIQP